MVRRLSALLFALLLAFATASCGEDSDGGSAGDDETTSQSDAGDDPETDEGPGGDDQDAGQDDDAGNEGDDEPERQNKPKNKQQNEGDKPDKKDDDENEQNDGNGQYDENESALPDDLPSEDSADPDDLPIDAKAVLKTCEDVEASDTWPPMDDVYFDSGQSNVVATADVKSKGQTVKIACDVTGSDANPQVMAYNPVG